MATITAKALLMVKSRTFWTVVVMFLVGGVQAVQSMIPAHDVVFVEGVLGLMATYFHLNPSQNYTA